MKNDHGFFMAFWRPMKIINSMAIHYFHGVIRNNMDHENYSKSTGLLTILFWPQNQINSSSLMEN